jgi:Ala-tRNA(Pro) deacylase
MVAVWNHYDTEAVMNLQSFLDENEIHYRISRHTAVYTAQELAATEHVSGRQVLKPVVVRADGQLVMCVLPACYRIDIGELKQQLLANVVELLAEQSLMNLFSDCQPGAEPPIGRMFGMTTLMDESLMHGNHVVFQAGTHEEAVTMSLADYRRIAHAELAHFGRPV